MFFLLGFSFIDRFKLEIVVLEPHGPTNYSISCRTTDPNAITTLFHEGQEILVGGRVTLDKQVFTIHGISSSDLGFYKCKANGSGTVIEQSAVVIHELVKGTVTWFLIQNFMMQNLYSYAWNFFLGLEI